MSDLLMNFLRRMRLLTVLIIVASLTFMVRLGDTYFAFKAMSGSAQAQEKAQPEIVKAEEAAPPKEELKTPTEAAADAKLPANPSKSLPTGKPETVMNSKQWADSTDNDDSTVRTEIYEDLQQRRRQLEQREMDMSQREALLKAGTEELNKKVEELNAIKTEIQSLLKKQSAEEQASTDRLVKIYEGMKPKEAARIFNQLDLDVLVPVVMKMSERKASQVIAVMEPDKARSLTLLLSEQNKLPGSGSTPAGFGNPNRPPSIPESAVQ